MYQNKTHSVDNRIVSIAQPWIRPIVRGKTKSPVEFGAKFDLSIDDNGLGRIEKISYDAYFPHPSQVCGQLIFHSKYSSLVISPDFSSFIRTTHSFRKSFRTP